jgi:RNA polymerase sigma factor for flagellar operon FliA
MMQQLDTREEMIVRNLPLVTFIVSKMADESGASPLDREDAIAYGTEGLIQAVDNYDSARGVTFASYAIRRIRGSILDAIRRNDLLPRSLRKGTRDLERANLDLANMLGRWPTVKELAMKLAMPIEQVRALMGHGGSRVVSLEKMMGDGAPEGSKPWEAADPDGTPDPALAVDRKAAWQLLGQAVNTLSFRDREIVRLRYGKAMPFHEIGRQMNLSESRVCQLHKRILSGLNKRLRKDMEAA